jgi:hypothetical protein
MIIEILKAHGKWVPGDVVDVTREKAAALAFTGVCRIHEDQTRRDYTPTPTEPPEPQQVTVNNYFLAPEQVQELETEPEKKEVKRSFFNRKK